MASKPSRLRPPQIKVRTPLEPINEQNRVVQDHIQLPSTSKMPVPKQALMALPQSTNMKIKTAPINNKRRSIKKPNATTNVTRSRLGARVSTKRIVIVNKRVSVRLSVSKRGKQANRNGVASTAVAAQSRKPRVAGMTAASAASTVSADNKRVGGAAAIKRPGAVADGAPKPKKLAKIPSWNYKERFRELKERHDEVTLHIADMEQKVVDYDKLQDECTQTKNENQSLKKELDSLRTVSKDYETLKSLYANTKKELKELKQQHEIVTQKYDDLLEKEKHHIEIIDELNKNIQELKEMCAQLTCENKKILAERHELDEERRSLHNTILDLKGNIRVFCRVRPPIDADEKDRMMCQMSFPEENVVEIKKSIINQISGGKTDQLNKFAFDRVFDTRTTQEEVFEDLAQLVQSALDGYNVCVFAYGQTGSGKTYTMQGGHGVKDKGMIPRTVDLIFNRIAKLKQSGWEYTVCASFLEIYNENIRDLLNINSNLKHEIMYNAGKGITVSNLTIQPMSSASELWSYMEMAQRNRATAATNFNQHSSRSHAVTQIYLKGMLNTKPNDDTASPSRDTIIYSGSINLVDLAGSESAKSASTERLTETQNINKSLTLLGNVMISLYNRNKHIPYRDSKLTYLLQSSLGGNSKTLMIVNISPFDDCFGESMNSLRFASKVKEVKTASKRNKFQIQS